VDLSKISNGGQIFAAASIVFFVSTFLEWYGAEVQGVDIPGATANAWDAGFLWGSLWGLLLIAGAVLLVLPAFGVKAPKIPTISFLAVAALATLFALLKLVIGEDDITYFGSPTIEVNASFGLYLSIIAAAAATFGGFLMFKESGGDLSDLKDMNKIKGQFSGSAGGGTPPPPPPPGMTPPPPPPVG